MSSGTDRGSALLETALLLPIYSFLCVGIIYFGNTILLHQEVNLSARYQSTGMGRPAAGGSQQSEMFLPDTGGAYLPDAWFIRFSGDIDYGNSQPWIDSADPYSSAGIREELVKVSWDVQRSFDLDGNEVTSQQYTGVGAWIYDQEILQDAYAIADGLNGWFRRQRFHYDVTHGGVAYYDTEWGHTAAWGLRGLPEPVIDTVVAAAARTGTVREAPSPSASGPKPIEEVIGDPQRFVETFDDYDDAGFNTTPVAGYPAFNGGEDFWAPN